MFKICQRNLSMKPFRVLFRLKKVFFVKLGKSKIYNFFNGILCKININ